MERVSDVLAQLGGCASFAQLTRLTPRRALAAAVRCGTVARPARGTYVLPGLSEAQQTAIAYDGVVSHQSAALAWNLPLLAVPAKPHITVPVKRRPRKGPPAVLHWSAIEPDDRTTRSTSLLRTVLDCARILPFGEALAVADAGLAAGLPRSHLMAGSMASRGPGALQIRCVADAAIAASGSFLESMLRALIMNAGLEGFEPQVLVRNGQFRARVDLGHRKAKIAVEAEGYEYHGTSLAFAADCRRYDDLVTAGWLVLRFTYHQILNDPDWVITSIQEALGHRGLYRPTGPMARKS